MFREQLPDCLFNESKFAKNIFNQQSIGLDNVVII